MHIIFGVFAIPIYRICKGGGLFKSIILCWGLYILWGVVWCVLLPAIMLRFSDEALMLFPESIGVPAIILTGFIPSALVCSIAYAIVVRVRQSLKAKAEIHQ